MTPERTTSAEHIGDAKKYLAHTYMSTKFDASSLISTFGKDVNIEVFIHKAVQNAYKYVLKETCLINKSGPHAVNVS
jgi:fructose-specific component phosphotransferase system IIB-like protein